LLSNLFFEELRLYIFTLKFVKYDSIILILRKKSTKNTLRNQAKLVFRDAHYFKKR